ncbi:hypothetical protein GCM10023192_22530 [Amycolatopsis samaneae]
MRDVLATLLRIAIAALVAPCLDLVLATLGIVALRGQSFVLRAVTFAGAVGGLVVRVGVTALVGGRGLEQPARGEPEVGVLAELLEEAAQFFLGRFERLAPRVRGVLPELVEPVGVLDDADLRIGRGRLTHDIVPGHDVDRDTAVVATALSPVERLLVHRGVQIGRLHHDHVQAAVDLGLDVRATPGDVAGEENTLLVARLFDLLFEILVALLPLVQLPVRIDDLVVDGLSVDRIVLHVVGEHLQLRVVMRNKQDRPRVLAVLYGMDLVIDTFELVLQIGGDVHGGVLVHAVLVVGRDVVHHLGKLDPPEQ